MNNDISKTAKHLYPVNDVPTGYKYWVRTLTEKLANMFSYSNMPTDLPYEQIEKNLMLKGWTAIFKHTKHGLVTCDGSVSGTDMYYLPTEYIYSQPVLGSGNLKIGKDVVIIYNSHIDTYNRGGLSSLVKRYARMLADIESSINIATVKKRAAFLLSAVNQQTAKTLDNIMDGIRMGTEKTIAEKSIIDNIKTHQFAQADGREISELIMARRDVLASFLEEIGVKMAFEKRERMITDEVASNNQLLLINQSDMLKHRREGIAKVNAMFGTNISVDITREYKPDFMEVENNDDINELS